MKQRKSLSFAVVKVIKVRPQNPSLPKSLIVDYFDLIDKILSSLTAELEELKKSEGKSFPQYKPVVFKREPLKIMVITQESHTRKAELSTVQINSRN